MMVETGANSSWSTSSLQTTAALLVGRFGNMHASRNCRQAQAYALAEIIVRKRGSAFSMLCYPL